MGSKSEQTDNPDQPNNRDDSGETAKRTARCILGIDNSALRSAAGELAELETVLAADYSSLAALPRGSDARELARLVACEFPALGEWRRRRVARFRVQRPAVCCGEIAVRAAPYTVGAGLGLWGFSCAMRGQNHGTFVIYLNTAHLPGAVAVTAAHELGHYFQHSIHPSTTHVGFAPMAANFAAHLSEEAELFSDSAAAFASFSAGAARRMARASDRSMAERAARAQELAQPEYRIDFTASTVNLRWRLRYLTAGIHFMKLRVALLDEAGV